MMMEAEYILIRFCSQKLRTNNYTSEASCLKDIHKGLMLLEKISRHILYHWTYYLSRKSPNRE